tara:strand:+ start:609 stop:905 length:297 start_codon:yes stop_codon:yes gene_type:complete
MTEKEMRKLTEMIVEALTIKQSQIDDEFIKKMSEHEKEDDFEIIFEAEEETPQREVYLEKIKDLQAELLFQLSKENYEIADTIKNVIDELKQRLDEEL